MMWCRMSGVAVRLAWPYVLAPWRSPLVRWRMETYGIRGDDGRLLTAAAIAPRQAWRFALANTPALLRFLRWAAELPRLP